MYWGKPSYLWLQLLPGAFLLGWSVAEWLRLRRLRRFGDANVLGVSQPWMPRAAALVLFLLGMTAIAAMLAVPFAGEGLLPSGRPEIRILLDNPPPDAGGDKFWEGIEDAVQVVLNQAPGAHFSVLTAGRPPEVRIHPTADAGGLLIMVSRLRYEWRSGSAGGLAETLAGYFQDQRSEFAQARMAVITAMPAEDLERLPVMQDDVAVPVVFVHVSGDRGAMRFGYRAPTGEWQWTSEPVVMREMLKAEIGPPVLWSSLSLVQCFALLAILLFSAEYVCRRTGWFAARKIVMSGFGLLLIGCIFPARTQCAQVQEPPSDPARTFVSSIARDLAIVTEVSLQEPYVGQQFSVIYRLRAQRPPVAVDIDPQQYPGFWTEVIPISQESASTARPLRGQPVVDFLLRQVVAYPIEEGALRLPPLSIKVKRAGRVSRQPDDWDVVGLSDPVGIRSLPLPPGAEAGKTMPLVGSAEGSMTWEGDDYTTVALELQGTANLALFEPLDWVRLRPGQACRAYLARAENAPRTVDLEGKRQLSLVQRQRWILDFAGSGSDLGVGDLIVPVFAPLEKSWNRLRIQGAQRPGSPSATGGQHTGATGAGADPGVRPRGARWAVLEVGMAVAGLAVIGTILFWLARKYRSGNDRIPDSPAVLEKKTRISPRAFLDSAHKLLEKCAREMGRQHNLGAEDTLLDRCWITVQGYRFNREPLPAEAYDQILSSVRQVLNQCAAAGPDAGRAVPATLEDEQS
jgi:hypothetical protein